MKHGTPSQANVVRRIRAGQEAFSRDPVHHRSVPNDRQIKVMSVEGDELRTQVANLLDKVAYQFNLGSLAYVGCAQRINAPALRLAACD